MSVEVAVWGWLDPYSSCLNPKTKPKIWCNVKMRKPHGSPPDAATVEGRRQELIQTLLPFFFLILQYKRREIRTFIFTQLSVQELVILSAVGKNMQIPLHSDENIPSFFT